MYLVVFRNRKRTDIDADAYGVEAEAMERMARAQPGFLSFKSYTAADGEVVALSEWETEQAARNWGRVAQHLEVQSRGRELYYESYTLFGCDAPRIHQFSTKDRS
ncbi:antibiotic biosynthesis monooxygenase [Altererythrobacter sp. RZ02]|uniref:Antibiotic biosynthesis monooxygenase n=1 Tax=Pontixanthobacter rizhaonensis TaxID=2730337 RepID=A0A848QS52_9SPHN|nr:antibiotic biosynthesis monooxygenase [Pontixanthobacter rizhaonensis]NMW32925.1 antibiotic biosynthesis monooxygenase [Pontixanthobacter rizhaonensis]